MDDLTAKLNQILSDPESMNQIKNLAAAMGLGGPPSQAQGQAAPPPQPQPPPAQPPPPQPQAAAPAPAGGTGTPSGLPDLSALAALLGGAQQPKPQQPATPPLIDPATLGTIVTVLSRMNNGNDKNIELLRALKPHFSESRSSKVDDAIRIIQLLSLLPIIRESGLLSGLLGGEKK